MNTTFSQPVAISRAPLARAHDQVLDTVRPVGLALRHAWQRLQAERLRAAEFEALRRLSPSVLRDIGASPEWQGEAQRWRDMQAIERDAFFRSF
jgi:hypothetical protein